eukprot:jgi/Bigna1/142042/aug1.67_g16750
MYDISFLCRIEKKESARTPQRNIMLKPPGALEGGDGDITGRTSRRRRRKAGNSMPLPSRRGLNTNSSSKAAKVSSTSTTSRFGLRSLPGAQNRKLGTFVARSKPKIKHVVSFNLGKAKRVEVSSTADDDDDDDDEDYDDDESNIGTGKEGNSLNQRKEDFNKNKVENQGDKNPASKENQDQHNGEKALNTSTKIRIKSSQEKPARRENAHLQHQNRLQDKENIDPSERSVHDESNNYLLARRATDATEEGDTPTVSEMGERKVTDKLNVILRPSIDTTCSSAVLAKEKVSTTTISSSLAATATRNLDSSRQNTRKKNLYLPATSRGLLTTAASKLRRTSLKFAIGTSSKGTEEEEENGLVEVSNNDAVLATHQPNDLAPSSSFQTPRSKMNVMSSRKKSMEASDSKMTSSLLLSSSHHKPVIRTRSEQSALLNKHKQPVVKSFYPAENTTNDMTDTDINGRKSSNFSNVSNQSSQSSVVGITGKKKDHSKTTMTTGIISHTAATTTTATVSATPHHHRRRILYQTPASSKSAAYVYSRHHHQQQKQQGHNSKHAGSRRHSTEPSSSSSSSIRDIASAGGGGDAATNAAASLSKKAGASVATITAPTTANNVYTTTSIKKVSSSSSSNNISSSRKRFNIKGRTYISASLIGRGGSSAVVPTIMSCS